MAPSDSTRLEMFGGSLTANAASIAEKRGGDLANIRRSEEDLDAMSMPKPMRILLPLLLLPALLSAQDNRVFYFPKPVARTPWQPPMRPVTRLADVKARHQGEPSWREPVIHDENSRAFLVQEPAGTRHERKLYPDSPAWWAVLDGRIRFDVEKPDRSFEVFEATKGSYVFVPERMLHSFEVVGNQPAIRFEVTLASATSVYPERPAKTE